MGRPAFTLGTADVPLSAAAPVQAATFDVPRAYPAHDHTFVELCLVLDGSGVHRTRAGGRAVGRGTLIAVPPGAVHAFERPRRLLVVNVCYLGAWLLSDARTLWEEPDGGGGLAELFVRPVLFRQEPAARQWRATPEAFDRLAAEADHLLAELARERPSPLLLRASLLAILGLMARSFPDAAGEPVPPEVSLTVEAIERAVAAGAPVTVEALAARVGCSAGHLSRRFATVVGEPPMRHYQRRRVQAACVQLMDPRRTVAAVAHDLGYADAAHLVRHFKKHTGQTPGGFRRRA